MGAYAPVPIDQGLLEQIKTQVFARALAGLNKEGLDYRGILYAGLMLTKNGPKVLEFNCRLGDPEAQAVLPILGGDFLKAALSCAEAALDASAIKTQNLSCLALTLASAGYPEKSSPPQSISGLGETGLETLIFHAGTKQVGKKWMATGGRVLTVCATAQDLSAARASAYQAARKIGYEGMQYRKDIGRTAAEAISHG
jgi:phosphoribosylamine--glycine ligase